MNEYIRQTRRAIKTIRRRVFKGGRSLLAYHKVSVGTHTRTQNGEEDNDDGGRSKILRDENFSCFPYMPPSYDKKEHKLTLLLQQQQQQNIIIMIKDMQCVQYFIYKIFLYISRKFSTIRTHTHS